MPRRSPAHSSGRRPRSGTPEELTDAARGIRLQKAMAEAGVASRRDCEALIEQGHVRVNGQLVTALPAWVDPAGDRIEVDGRELPRPRRAKTAGKSIHQDKAARHAAPPTVGKHYVMLHKPRGVISTTDDPEGRRSVTDLVQLPGHPRLFPVGRLDADSTGLILLTDDGELANRLTHPRYGVAKQYRVSVRGKISQEDLARLRKGLYLAPKGAKADAAGPAVKRAAVESVSILGFEQDRTRGDRTALGITLREGQNREIRRLLARLGFKVRRLKRMGIGPIKLKGVAPGAWRKLTGQEVTQLYKAAGLEQTTKTPRTPRGI